MFTILFVSTVIHNWRFSSKIFSRFCYLAICVVQSGATGHKLNSSHFQFQIAVFYFWVATE